MATMPPGPRLPQSIATPGLLRGPGAARAPGSPDPQVGAVVLDGPQAAAESAFGLLLGGLILLGWQAAGCAAIAAAAPAPVLLPPLVPAIASLGVLVGAVLARPPIAIRRLRPGAARARRK